MLDRRRYPRQDQVRCPRCGEALLRWGPDEWICPDCTRLVPTKSALGVAADRTLMQGLPLVRSVRELFERFLWRE
jgi:tRNA(Ile2) C34 agmatinyltransferase TiaS